MFTSRSVRRPMAACVVLLSLALIPFLANRAGAEKMSDDEKAMMKAEMMKMGEIRRGTPNGVSKGRIA